MFLASTCTVSSIHNTDDITQILQHINVFPLWLQLSHFLLPFFVTSCFSADKEWLSTFQRIWDQKNNKNAKALRPHLVIYCFRL